MIIKFHCIGCISIIEKYYSADNLGNILFYLYIIIFSYIILLLILYSKLNYYCVLLLEILYFVSATVLLPYFHQREPHIE